MRADAEANRSAVVAAARQLFAAQGLEVPLSAVAELAGVGIATLYRNFPTRALLLHAVLDDLELAVHAAIERFDTESSRAPESAWRAFVSSLAALQPGALAPAFSAGLISEHGIDADVRDRREANLDAIQHVLDRAGDAGLVCPGLTVVQFLLGLATITRPLPTVGMPVIEGQRDWLVEVYLRGLRA